MSDKFGSIINFLSTKKLECNTRFKGFWEEKYIFSVFHERYVTLNSLRAGLTLGVGLARHWTTWVDLPCCYWLNLNLQLDFTSLNMHANLQLDFTSLNMHARFLTFEAGNTVLTLV